MPVCARGNVGLVFVIRLVREMSVKTRVGDPHNAREPGPVPAMVTPEKSARPFLNPVSRFLAAANLRRLHSFENTRAAHQLKSSYCEAACECDRSSLFSRLRRRPASRFKFPRSRTTIAAQRSSRWPVRRMSGGFAAIRFRIPTASSPACGKIRHDFRTDAARRLNPTTARHGRGAAGAQPIATPASPNPRTTAGSGNRRGAMFADVDPFGRNQLGHAQWADAHRAVG